MEYKLPTVTIENGQVVLNDHMAAEAIAAVCKVNCERTLQLNKERIDHFKRRFFDKGLSPNEHCLVVINVDDHNGAEIADVLMDGFDWQAIRDRGEVPFARGINSIQLMEEVLKTFDDLAWKKLNDSRELVAVVVDHGVAEVFPV